jgi:hypothetical protein
MKRSDKQWRVVSEEAVAFVWADDEELARKDFVSQHPNKPIDLIKLEYTEKTFEEQMLDAMKSGPDEVEDDESVRQEED